MIEDEDHRLKLLDKFDEKQQKIEVFKKKLKKQLVWVFD